MGHAGAVRRVVFNPDGKSLASSADGDSIRIWGVEDGLLRRHPRAGGDIVGLVYSPDGSRLYIGDSRGVVTTWEWDAGRGAGSLRLQVPYMAAVALDLGARRIASAGSEQSLAVWDLDTGALAHTLQRRGA